MVYLATEEIDVINNAKASKRTLVSILQGIEEADNGDKKPT